MRFIHQEDGITKAAGHIDPLPGSSQVAVFHSAFVRPDYRKTGVGFTAHNERLCRAIIEAYDYGLCTVDLSNEAQIKILEDSGWKRLDTFKSQKTGHVVALYGINL